MKRGFQLRDLRPKRTVRLALHPAANRARRDEARKGKDRERPGKTGQNGALNIERRARDVNAV